MSEVREILQTITTKIQSKGEVEAFFFNKNIIHGNLDVNCKDTSCFVRIFPNQNDNEFKDPDGMIRIVGSKCGKKRDIERGRVQLLIATNQKVELHNVFKSIK